MWMKEKKECIFVLPIVLSADCHLKTICEGCVTKNFKLYHPYNFCSTEYYSLIYIL